MTTHSPVGKVSEILGSYGSGEMDWPATLAILKDVKWAEIPLVESEEGAALGDWPMPPEGSFLEVQEAHDRGIITTEQRDEVAGVAGVGKSRRGGAPKSKGVTPVSVTDLPIK